MYMYTFINTCTCFVEGNIAGRQASGDFIRPPEMKCQEERINIEKYFKIKTLILRYNNNNNKRKTEKKKVRVLKYRVIVLSTNKK